jgi:alkylated DNA nucleotide flippase Atl1
MIIRALRDAGGFTTVYNVASLAGCSSRHVFRMLSRLAKQQRIRCIKFEDIGGERTTKYCLIDRRAA